MLGIGITEFQDIFNRLSSSAIRVRSEQCSRQRHRLSTCTRCADACPTGAIRWEEELVVDSEKCSGCGACATVCPTGALAAQSPSLAELVEAVGATLKGNSDVVFACERYQEMHAQRPYDVIAVNCLARLDESILVTAAALGAERVWLLDGVCDGCPDYACREVTEASVARANSLLESLGHPGRVALADDFSAPADLGRDGKSGQTHSRRSFLNLMSRQASRLGAATADTLIGSHAQGEAPIEETRKGGLPTYLPEKRRLLLDGLKRANQRAGNACVGAALFGARFGFTDACTGCQMCAFFCPTGALQKLEKDGKVGVSHQAAYCTDCRLCEDVCYMHAVRLTDDAPLGQVLDGSIQEHVMRDAGAAPWQDAKGERLKRSVIEALGW